MSKRCATGRPRSEAGLACPVVKDGAEDREAQHDKRPGDLVAATHTRSADKIPHGEIHQRILGETHQYDKDGDGGSHRRSFNVRAGAVTSLLLREKRYRQLTIPRNCT